jgi:hypothetical protein
MLLGCTLISVVSLIIWTMYLDMVERIVVSWRWIQWPRLMLYSATATVSGRMATVHSDRQIRQVFSPSARVAPALEKPVLVTFLPYMSMTFNCISRLLSRHNIKSVSLLLKKIPSFLRPVKDDLGLKTPGVYSAPCKCGQVCIGQTSCSIETRVKEHQHNIRLEHPDKSAMAKWNINLGHRIHLQDTTILSTKSRYMDQMRPLRLSYTPAT